MADEAQDSGLPGMVDRKSHERIATERDNLKAELNQAKTAYAGLMLERDAYKHFAAKEGVTGDRMALAMSAANDASIRGAEPDALGAALDTWYDQQQTLFRGPEPVPVEQIAETPPVPAPMAPSPAGSGTTPVGGPLTYMQWRQQNPTGTLDDFASAKQRGDIALTPQ